MTEGKSEQNLTSLAIGLVTVVIIGPLAVGALSSPKLLAIDIRSASLVITTSAKQTLEWVNWPRRNLHQCENNIKNMATAMEMYSVDNAGLYPKSLGQLLPNYLARIPKCPSAGRDTYTSSLQVASHPDNFTVYCSGNNHSWAKAPANYPEYDNSSSH
jgi:hypothetical protein